MFPPLEAIHSDSLATIPTASYSQKPISISLRMITQSKIHIPKHNLKNHRRLVTGQWKMWIPWVREEGGSKDLKEIFLFLHILANPITRGNLRAIGYPLSESLTRESSINHQLSTSSTNTALSQSTTNLSLVVSYVRLNDMPFRRFFTRSANRKNLLNI